MTINKNVTDEFSQEPQSRAGSYALVAGNRVRDLAETINKTDFLYNIDNVRIWAKEIILQCDLVKEIDKEHAKRRCHMA